MQVTEKDKYYFLLLLFMVVSQTLPALIYFINDRQMPAYILIEDGIYESIAAIFCLLASIIYLYCFVKYPKQINYFLFSSRRNITALVFSLLLFLVFAEEISWGQRILNIKTPEMISGINFQKEINLHNLKIIQNKNNVLSALLFNLLVAYLFIFPLLNYAFHFIKNPVERLGIPIASLPIALSAAIIGQIDRFNQRIIYGDKYISDYYHLGEAYESNIEILLFFLSLEYLYLCRHKTRSHFKTHVRFYNMLNLLNPNREK